MPHTLWGWKEGIDPPLAQARNPFSQGSSVTFSLLYLSPFHSPPMIDSLGLPAFTISTSL